jgi:hypothetical protein
MIIKNSMMAKHDDRCVLCRGGVFPGDEVVQCGYVRGAGQADQSADEYGQPQPGLAQ